MCIPELSIIIIRVILLQIEMYRDQQFSFDLRMLNKYDLVLLSDLTSVIRMILIVTIEGCIGSTGVVILFWSHLYHKSFAFIDWARTVLLFELLQSSCSFHKKIFINISIQNIINFNHKIFCEKSQNRLFIPENKEREWNVLVSEWTIFSFIVERKEI